MQQQSRVTRADVLDLVRRRFEVETFSTRDIADGLGVSEMKVRAVVGWLVAGGLVRRVGSVNRRDRSGVPYRAASYRWSGKTEIRRCPQDRESRRTILESPSVSAFDWLSRAW